MDIRENDEVAPTIAEDTIAAVDAQVEVRIRAATEKQSKRIEKLICVNGDRLSPIDSVAGRHTVPRVEAWAVKCVMDICPGNSKFYIIIDASYVINGFMQHNRTGSEA